MATRRRNTSPPNGNGTLATIATVSALSVKVDGIEADVRDLKGNVDSIDVKLDRAVASLGAEFRLQLGNLSKDIADRQRTPWAVIWTAIGVMLTIVAVFGSQALSPISRDIEALKQNSVVWNAFNNETGRTAKEREQLRADLNITIQQQRYNADMAIIRADILSKLPREEYARLHEDLKELIRVAIDRIDKREDFITGRITRLEDLNLTHANGGKTP
jgi:hypothetical protein